MTASRTPAEVPNQSPPYVDVDLYGNDRALQEAVIANGAEADEAAFVDQIRRMLERAPSLHASRLNIIGLKHVKERLGSSWRHVADRANRIARNVIERHLGPGDIYATSGDDSYITVFARLSELEARVKCYLIGNRTPRSTWR